MTKIPIREASSRLSELIDQLQPGEEIGLTRGSDTVARLVKNSTQKHARQFGLGKAPMTMSTLSTSKTICREPVYGVVRIW